MLSPLWLGLVCVCVRAGPTPQAAGPPSSRQGAVQGGLPSPSATTGPPTTFTASHPLGPSLDNLQQWEEPSPGAAGRLSVGGSSEHSRPSGDGGAVPHVLRGSSSMGGGAGAEQRDSGGPAHLDSGPGGGRRLAAVEAAGGGSVRGGGSGGGSWGGAGAERVAEGSVCPSSGPSRSASVSEQLGVRWGMARGCGGGGDPGARVLGVGFRVLGVGFRVCVGGPRGCSGLQPARWSGQKGV